MNQIKLLPSGKIVQAKSGENLREALIQNGFEIKSSCGGCASCGDCVLKIIDGEEHLDEISFEEKQLLGNVYHITSERLSCQLTVQGDLTIDISNHSQNSIVKPKTVVRKSGEAREEKEEEVKPPKEGGWKKPRAFKYDTDKE